MHASTTDHKQHIHPAGSALVCWLGSVRERGRGGAGVGAGESCGLCRVVHKYMQLRMHSCTTLHNCAQIATTVHTCLQMCSQMLTAVHICAQLCMHVYTVVQNSVGESQRQTESYLNERKRGDEFMKGGTVKARRRRGMEEGGKMWREADEWVGRCGGGEWAGFGGGWVLAAMAGGFVVMSWGVVQVLSGCFGRCELVMSGCGLVAVSEISGLVAVSEISVQA